MAELSRERNLMRLREGEAHSYALRASDALGGVARRASAAADSFHADDELRRAAREQFRGEAGRDLLETPYWEKLPSELRALFRESDIDPRSFLGDWQATWRTDDPVASCVRLLRTSSEAAGALAVSLLEWGPEERPDAEPTTRD
jgi:hypothetical protein